MCLYIANATVKLGKVTKLLDIIVCGGIIELAADIFLRKCYKAVIFRCDNVAFFAHKEDLETLLIGIENRCKFLKILCLYNQQNI